MIDDGGLRLGFGGVPSASERSDADRSGELKCRGSQLSFNGIRQQVDEFDVCATCAAVANGASNKATSSCGVGVYFNGRGQITVALALSTKQLRVVIYGGINTLVVEVNEIRVPLCMTVLRQ